VIDETGLKDGAMLLGAAISYRGRALPLALHAYHPEMLKRSLWAIREALLVRYPPGWLRFIAARGDLSFLSLALEWLDSPPAVRTRLRRESESA
jgi:hypothetical protein